MNPRVLVLTTYFRPVIGGVETNAERLARYLQAAGFPVRIVTKRVTRDLPDVEDLGVPVNRIGPFGERSAIGKWQLLPIALWWLVRRAASYDVVCVIDYRATGAAAVLARMVTGRPAILQAQTPGGLVIGPMTWPAIAIYRRADALACISHALEREAEAAGVPPERIHFLPNAVDMDRFRPPTPLERSAARRRLEIPDDAVVFLFLGRLSREKGVMDLMEAWRRVRPANALLAVAGPDMIGHPWDVGPAARAFVEQHDLAASVRFLGSITDVAGLLHIADVAVQPSHFEALGLSAVEALAAGLPVIASAIGGLLDLVVDGRNGKLCPPKDPAVLAACIRALLDDPALRRSLAQNARPSVVDVYDERVVFERFATLIRRLATSTSTRG
jgi:glycosyltransferase involved in cell wall biosynthesis